MKIKQVNIYGFHFPGKHEIKLENSSSNIHYLFGKNGVGKSTILQAIQLGLLGYIPGTPKTKTGVFSHANGDKMYVELILRDGGKDIVIRRSLVQSGSQINMNMETVPKGVDVKDLIKDLELPIFNFNEFLGLTANKLKDWFIEFLPNNDVSIDWEFELKDALDSAGLMSIDNTDFEHVLEDSLNYINDLEESGVDQVRKANEYFKSCQSLKKSEIDRMSNTIQSLVYYDDVDDSMSYEELEKKISELRLLQAKQIDDRVKLANFKKFEDYPADSVENDKRYSDCRANTDRLEQELNNKDLDPSQYSEELSSIANKVADIRSNIKLRESVIRSNGVCPIVSQKCVPISELVEEYTELNSKDEKDMVELQERYRNLEQQRAKLTDKLFELKKKISHYKEICNQLENAYAKKKRFMETEGVGLDRIRKESLDIDYNIEINALLDLQVKVSANNKYNELIDSLTASKYKLDRELAAIKVWIKHTGVNGMQNSFASPFEDFKNSMDKYIPILFKNAECSFNLSGKANSFSFGLTRGDKYIPYELLSSGEKCMYMLCMMLCLTYESSSNLKLILVDDLFDHLDDENIEKLFESLYNVNDIQMIFAGVKKVSERFKDNVIEL